MYTFRLFFYFVALFSVSLSAIAQTQARATAVGLKISILGIGAEVAASFDRYLNGRLAA